MTDFKLRLKNLIVSSFYANKIRGKDPIKRFVKNKSVVCNIQNYNDKSDKIAININNIRHKQNIIRKPINYKSKIPTHRISLYKKYKKYNNNTKNIISRNIINDYKTKNNTSSYFYDQSLSSRTNNNNKPSYSYSINTIRNDLSILNNKPSYSPSTYRNNLSILNTKPSYSPKTIRSDYSSLNDFHVNYKKKTTSNYLKKNLNIYSNDLLYKFLAKKEKQHLRRVEQKIIKKIELIENENKDNKVKNLLINRPPIILDNYNSKFNNNDYNYNYFIPSSRHRDNKNIKNKPKNSQKKNFLNLNNLNDIIYSIKNNFY